MATNALVVSVLWSAYRKGAPVRCPRDRVGALALSIGDTDRRYEFRCMKCGWSTGWFEATDETVTAAQLSSDEPTERHGDDE